MADNSYIGSSWRYVRECGVPPVGITVVIENLSGTEVFATFEDNAYILLDGGYLYSVDVKRWRPAD